MKAFEWRALVRATRLEEDRLERWAKTDSGPDIKSTKEKQKSQSNEANCENNSIWFLVVFQTHEKGHDQHGFNERNNNGNKCEDKINH